jgi:hypothetical protein
MQYVYNYYIMMAVLYLNIFCTFNLFIVTIHYLLYQPIRSLYLFMCTRMRLLTQFHFSYSRSEKTHYSMMQVNCKCCAIYRICQTAQFMLTFFHSFSFQTVNNGKGCGLQITRSSLLWVWILTGTLASFTWGSYPASN